MNVKKAILNALLLVIDSLGVVLLFAFGFILAFTANITIALFLPEDPDWDNYRHKAEHIGRYKDGKRVGKWEFYIESILDNGNDSAQSLVGRYENGVRQGVWVYRGLSYLVYDKGIVRKYIMPFSFKKDKSQVGYYNEHNVFVNAAYARYFAGIVKEYDENGIFIQTREINEQDRQEIADFLSDSFLRKIKVLFDRICENLTKRT